MDFFYHLPVSLKMQGLFLNALHLFAIFSVYIDNYNIVFCLLPSGFRTYHLVAGPLLMPPNTTQVVL